MNGSLAYHSVALNIQHSCHILYIFGLLNAQRIHSGPFYVYWTAISSAEVIHRELWHTVDDSSTVFAFSLQYSSTRFTPQHDICRFNHISYEIQCHLKSKRFYGYNFGTFNTFLQDLYLPVLRSLQQLLSYQDQGLLKHISCCLFEKLSVFS